MSPTTIKLGILSLATLVALSLSGPAAAEPCEVTRTETGYRFHNCFLFNERIHDIVKEVHVGPGAILLSNLPDLSSDDGDYRVSGTSVEVQVRTENTGPADAQDFEVTAVVTITGGVLTSPQSVMLTARAQPLKAESRQWTTVGYVTVPDRIYDYDLEVEFIVDSHNISSGGEIWELDESNNLFNDGICRVYGEQPDTSVRACN